MFGIKSGSRELSPLEVGIQKKYFGAGGRHFPFLFFARPFLRKALLELGEMDVDDFGSCYYCFLLNFRATSGRNSFSTPDPILMPIVMPKLIAASPAECWLGGSQGRERKAPAAVPPSCEYDKCRFPSSSRANRPLCTAYPVRDQK